MEGRQVISSHWSPESSFKVPSLLGTTPGDLPLVPRRQKLYSLLPSDRELSVEVSDFLSGQGGGAKSPPVAGSSMLSENGLHRAEHCASQVNIHLEPQKGNLLGNRVSLQASTVTV